MDSTTGVLRPRVPSVATGRLSRPARQHGSPGRMPVKLPVASAGRNRVFEYAAYSRISRCRTSGLLKSRVAAYALSDQRERSLPFSSRNREEIKGVWGKKTFPPKMNTSAGEARHRSPASGGERGRRSAVAAGDRSEAEPGSTRPDARSGMQDGAKTALDGLGSVETGRGRGTGPEAETPLYGDLRAFGG